MAAANSTAGRDDEKSYYTKNTLYTDERLNYEPGRAFWTVSGKPPVYEKED